jgi:hypothetical protein
MLSLDLIIKTHPPNNKKVNIYHLTEKGLSISPIVYDLMAWSNNYLSDDHTDMTTFDHLSISKLPREEAINYIQEHYTNSVASVLSEDY